jgi:glycosyltransferase involved in cell wall biosynthesis
LPTIASAVGGNAEIVRDGITGLLAPAQDSESLANALLRLLMDTELAKRLAKDSQRYVIENFSFERLVREVDDLYTGLLRRKGATN